ncbi:MAG: ABC transporter substrate-binding protein [Proteobacteria bacterium]|nr:ABC transporter substrate-binding protein [Pseudomonadota bacterium]
MKTILIAGIASLALTGTACARDLVVAQSQDLRSNIPGVNRDGTTDHVMLHIVEGLVGYTAGGQVKPLLAKSVDLSSDRRTYTFHLRQGVHFHNGKVLTADDVVWNWRRYLDPATKWTCLRDFNGKGAVHITDVKAVGSDTVTMSLEKPSGIFLALMARAECGFSGIISPDSVAADGTFKEPIGTGPFKWAEWKKGQYVRLAKFDGYVSPDNDGKPDGAVGSKRPLVDGIKFMDIPDAATVKAGLESGVLDLAEVPSDLITELKRNKKIRVIVGHSSGKNLLYMQTRDPVLSKPGVRRAIAMSLDLPQLTAAASNGTGEPNGSAIPQRSSYYDDVQKRRLPYDIAAAKKELAAAGYKSEPITIIANKRSNLPSFQMAVIAQAMMQQAGLNVKIEVLDFATQVDRRRSGKYQIISQTIAPRLDPALLYEFFVGDKNKNASLMWDDPKAIALMNAAIEEADPAKRQAIFDQFHELMLKEMPGVFLYDMSIVWASTSKLVGDPVWEGNARLWEVSLTP